MRTRVLVHHAVSESLDLVAATCTAMPEAGGILLGAYRGADMEVTGRTENLTQKVLLRLGSG